MQTLLVYTHNHLEWGGFRSLKASTDVHLGALLTSVGFVASNRVQLKTFLKSEVNTSRKHHLRSLSWSTYRKFHLVWQPDKDRETASEWPINNQQSVPILKTF